MKSSDIIATHPYLGPVTSHTDALVFHPPEGRAGVDYRAQVGIAVAFDDDGTPCFGGDLTAADYQALLPRLSAFEAFCRNLDACDQRVHAHFATWPPTSGSFQLFGVWMGGNDDDSPFGYPTAEQNGEFPFALQYRALNQEACDYADVGTTISALFDAAGNFCGIEYGTEEAMRDLPDVIPRPKWPDGYRHAFFGRRKLCEFTQLGTAMVGGRKIPFDLFMTMKEMTAFEPEQLDHFVPLLQDMEQLDARVRRDFPENVRIDWLKHHYGLNDPPAALRRALARLFPGARAASGVSRQAFVAALVLKCGRFSLSPDSPALTLDYHILPFRINTYAFAARFRANGDLLEIAIES